MNKIRNTAAVLILLLLCCLCTAPAFADSRADLKDQEIEAYIRSLMNEGRIPGLAVAIVSGHELVYSKVFGYADLATQEPVTEATLFELGSTSKAFTALGILKLQQEGRVNLDAPVSAYLPWFEMRYEGSYKGQFIPDQIDITLRQLLHHTSGIPSRTIDDIPISDDGDALEETVRTVVGQKLDSYPGERYQYATINYDILGLIIAKVSGVPYEEYMSVNVLKPLDLKDTYAGRAEGLTPLATGYKLQFLRAAPYNAPTYRGNTPAGYYISNLKDVAKWLKIQLGTEADSDFDQQLIDASHIPDRTVAPTAKGSSYAFGWNNYQKGGGELSHGGSNPNFSSFFVIRPEEQWGVAVLANLNSSFTEEIGQGIMSLLTGEELPDKSRDSYMSLDHFSSAMIVLMLTFSLLTVYFIAALLFKAKQERERPDFKGSLVKVLILCLVTAILVYCLSILPNVMYSGLSWNFVKVWAPRSFPFAVGSLLTAVVVFGIYCILYGLFSRNRRNSIFVVSILSVVSGLGNAVIIFIINAALNREDGFQDGLLLYFLAGIVIYVCGQRLVRSKVIFMANDIVYTKRIELIDKVMNANYAKFEAMEDGKIQSALVNDTETISGFSNVLIAGITSFVTLFCCFIYLGIINFYGLLVSIGVIILAAGSYFLAGKMAGRLWEQTRDMQNVFFKFIHDLIFGYKELYINKHKRQEFSRDVRESCEAYRNKRIQGDINFANVFVIGELLFTFVIGVVAFVFPLLFDEIQNSTLKSYVFVFLYMTGPVNGLLNAIPNIVRVRISWGRINLLAKELESFREEDEPLLTEDSFSCCGQTEICFQQVEFKYSQADGREFAVGPVSFSCTSGEIIFIVGGNGSGKSTLAKLMTGLYQPLRGVIHVNGKKVNPRELSENYSTVFSDYYLFDKLYGVDTQAHSEEISLHLHELQLQGKLEIDHGAFSSLKLSSGQKKRLALLVSYLEDRPICLFDEWAAEQDPEFKEYFYTVLLPRLKLQGKCVIVITHDDRYFHIADRIMVMESGQLSQVQATAHIREQSEVNGIA
ncbi:cyclic peptide export ABC transporter [Paenibacillus tritici]|uniref:cyclic peptide export ABC transporter n=1 Tax=Paenibacillus tritici TaxID=1873425 RepID=UPI0031BAA6E2